MEAATAYSAALRARLRGNPRTIEDWAMLRPLPTILLEWLFPGIEREPISVLEFEYKIGNMPLTDLAQLVHLAKHLDPKLIFEIGTFEGTTTLQLALNTRAEILTLDLPPSSQRVVKDTGLDVYPDKAGNRFLGTSQAAHIRQLYGDSQTFDFESWHGKIDLVFVDAGHHYESVKKDIETALRLITPTGVIVWHDYASWAPGVVQALEEALQQHPLIHLSDTSLAVYFADRDTTQRWQFEWVRKELVTEMEAALQTMQSGQQVMQNAYQKLQAAHDELSGEHEELQAHFDQLESDYQKLQDRLKDMKTRREDLAERYKTLEARYNELEAQHQPLTRATGLLRALPRAVVRGLVGGPKKSEVRSQKSEVRENN